MSVGNHLFQSSEYAQVPQSESEANEADKIQGEQKSGLGDKCIKFARWIVTNAPPNPVLPPVFNQGDVSHSTATRAKPD